MRKFLTFAVFLFLIPAAAQADEGKKLLNIQQVTSPGGIKAWLVEDHNVPVISVEFGFKGAGSILDPADKQGLARMLSNTMDEGAGDMLSQDFQKELRDLSISLFFGSTRDDFTGSLKTLTLNKDRAFELLSLAVNKPRFDDEPIGRMRAENESRVRASMADPDWIAARLLNDISFRGHVYAQNSGGTLSGLEKITAADLHSFHDNYLGKDNLIVAVAGDITKEDLGKALDEIFGALPAAKLPPAPTVLSLQNAGTLNLYKQDIPQTIIEMLQPGIDHKDPDFQTAQVMNFVLGSSGFGSRLTEEIREKRGLTYGIYSSLMDMDYFDGLGVSTSTENKNASQVIALTKAEWKKMKDTLISDKELKDAQTYLIGSIPLSLTSTDDIAGLLLSLELQDLPADYLDRREKAIRATTAADVQRVAKKLLQEDKMAIVMVGEPDNAKDAKLITTVPNAE